MTDIVSSRVVCADRMPQDTPVVPVLIVGAGACGQTAAIRLRECRIDCLMLERDAYPSGSTALSSGFIPAAETQLQKSLHIDDTIAQFAQDVIYKSKGQAAAHLVKAYTQGVTKAIDMLWQRGIPFEVIDGFLYPGHSARRMHAVPQRTGDALLAALGQLAQNMGADLLVQARVTELWVDPNNHVLGVGYLRPNGTQEFIGCQALLLSCNGFGGNRQMVKDLLPDMAEASFGGHVGNDGSAILWGQQLDAALADLGGYQGHGSWVTPQGILMTWAPMTAGAVQVNRLGQRFHNETLGYSEAAVHVLHQPEGIAWNVFDSPLLDMARTFPDFVQAEKAGALKVASDIEALSSFIGCPAQRLEETLQSVAPGITDSFGRTFTRRLEPPYYAVKVTGALFHTQGGLDIDAQCRVRNQNGAVFPNLWAAGGAARGVSGNEVWGYLSGNGLLSAVGGGWVAAGSIALALSGPNFKASNACS
ncbi:MAG: FAD-dependent oxidoreductase [Burkholderiaceae bacterium]|jgi:fumarate reductase flavoprotein subunit|nr:FAD-dependent oxidoreductase [Burkholderiaceae bacterium]